MKTSDYIGLAVAGLVIYGVYKGFSWLKSGALNPLNIFKNIFEAKNPIDSAPILNDWIETMPLDIQKTFSFTTPTTTVYYPQTPNSTPAVIAGAGATNNDIAKAINNAVDAWKTGTTDFLPNTAIGYFSPEVVEYQTYQPFPTFFNNPFENAVWGA